MDFIWVKRKDCKVLLQDSTLVVFAIAFFLECTYYVKRYITRYIKQ
jgi:hypothetical protein